MVQDPGKETFGIRETEQGLRFSVFATGAESVKVCLFGHDGELLGKYPLDSSGDYWQGTVNPGRNDVLYCFEITRTGQSQYLADPFARNMNFLHLWRKSKTWPAPVAGLPARAFDWGDDSLPRIPVPQMVIYEAHVRGLTQQFNAVPEDLRGTYGALCHERLVAHLQSLGVTTLELLPVHGKSEDLYLAPKGLTNYWGYNTLAYFAPESEYAAGDAVTEFKTMVRELHRAGIEVILDVVYNHTGEGHADAAATSFRGLAERAYYRIAEDGTYIDYTHCGNTLNTDNAHTRAMVLQSLRYWAEEMHVDGFRFDLAPAIFRKNGAVDFQHELHAAIVNDPVLRERKLIAEPWDLGPDGYQRGRFPQPWLEWNDSFRDTARRFWKGEFCAGELRDLMMHRGRPVINFVTCHDGFTLADLVSHEQKHNEANLEDNRDGADHNHSFNCGTEGETTDTQILSLRARQVRNLLLTLFCAQDIPMLLAGDELGNSQKGNNNAYCQDNPISWLNWEDADRDLLAFVKKLPGLRQQLLAVSLPQAIEAPTHNGQAFGIRFDRHLLLVNAAADNVMLPLHGLTVREILHTGRPAQDEVISEILYLQQRSSVVLEIMAT
ncbi:MAG: glycogen debranching protein [Spirochaetota bacterium]